MQGDDREQAFAERANQVRTIHEELVAVSERLQNSTLLQTGWLRLVACLSDRESLARIRREER